MASPTKKLDKLENVVTSFVEQSSGTFPSKAGSVSSQLLYAGESGLRNWLALVHEPGYQLVVEDSDPYRVRRHCLEAVHDVGTSIFVSLGAGDGLHDIPLVAALQSRMPQSYIPVDASRALLEHAISNVQGHADVPLAVLCDFESGFDFLRSALDKHSATRPRLLSLLGGTLGNLDRLDFLFTSLLHIMNPHDACLLDVPLAGPAWCAELEPRLKLASFSPAFRRFLAGGLVNAGLAASEVDVLGTFDTRVEPILSHDSECETRAMISIVDRVSKAVILRLHRFNWPRFLSWLESIGFSVAYAKCSLSQSDTFGMGVVLIRKRCGEALPT